ncbi:unnamed protein product [Lactuca virosa]|uniref:Uncharacterized protein n=1 Tax=Lactuca virosa TaxID=75947 RepID=A0AAU9NZ95_9ASTR|nr:unnamed protein product [Lactuca virosa]
MNKDEATKINPEDLNCQVYVKESTNSKNDMQGQNGNCVKISSAFPVFRVSDVVSKPTLVPDIATLLVSVPAGPIVSDLAHVPTSRLETPPPTAESLADGAAVLTSVPTASLAASFSAISAFSTRLVGFSGGFGHMEGVHMSEDSLTHPPSFANKIFRGNVTIS